MGLDNPLHIAVLVVLLLILFGAKRLPEIGRSLGTGMREFKDGVTGAANPPTLSQNTQQPPATPQQAAQAFGAPAPEPAPVPVEPSQQV
jgi:sec-independent protein translocase protein TatA